jgi:DNA-binding NarL/FixJ family response regulator
MKILFIEDHPYKRGQILSFLNEIFPDGAVESKGSYNSGLKELILNHSKYDYLLLDISMPNYDISAGESGGDYIPLAGKLILKEMYLREIPTKVIVVTMYENYVDGTPLFHLDELLRSEFAENYLGYVYFTAANNDWKNQLVKLLK